MSYLKCIGGIRSTVFPRVVPEIRAFRLQLRGKSDVCFRIPRESFVKYDPLDMVAHLSHDNILRNIDIVSR
jgi:hypothetical protein